MSIAEVSKKHPKRPLYQDPQLEQRTVNDEIKPAAMPEHLKQILKKYRQPNAWKASWQMLNTLIPWGAAWIAAWLAYDYNRWISLGLSLFLGVIMIRIFVLHHDCTHGSFFKSRRANEFWGLLMGAIVFTPFHRWRRSHNYHHAHSGDLDHRGEGYITMYTVEEYQKLTAWQKFMYRVYRHPIFMFIIGPYIQFLVLERFTFDLPKNAHVARWGVWKTNLILASVVAAVGYFGGLAGLERFAFIMLPAALVCTIIGVWLFFVQHNYDQAYFKHHKDWNFAVAALEGCSFYDLPQVLHWFSGNIGFHHIHHLDSLVPNYNLQACHFENPEFQTPYRLTLWESRKCVGLDLWDESTQRMVPLSTATACTITS
jgi:omega-6 fatty acid desaturase (delta-12 desaturase)